MEFEPGTYRVLHKYRTWASRYSILVEAYFEIILYGKFCSLLFREPRELYTRVLLGLRVSEDESS
jgi:hypothetical protein